MQWNKYVTQYAQQRITINFIVVVAVLPKWSEKCNIMYSVHIFPIPQIFNCSMLVHAHYVRTVRYSYSTPCFSLSLFPKIIALDESNIVLIVFPFDYLIRIEDSFSHLFSNMYSVCVV